MDEKNKGIEVEKFGVVASDDDGKLEVSEVPASEWMKNPKYQLYAAIIDFISKNLYAPSFNELCGIMSYKSKSTVDTHLKKLKDEGLITYEEGKPRTIKLLGYQLNRCGKPLCSFCGEELKFVEDEVLEDGMIKSLYHCERCNAEAEFSTQATIEKQ